MSTLRAKRLVRRDEFQRRLPGAYRTGLGVQRRRDQAVLGNQHCFDQAGQTRRGLRVPEIGLDRTDP